MDLDIKLIKQYMCEFRSALDIVVEKRQYGRLSIFAHFPDECCGYTSDLLAEYLLYKGIARERIQFVSGESDEENYTHCWLMLDDQFFLDITADQFNKRTYFSKYTPIPQCCIVPRGTYLYECFDNAKIQYEYNVGLNSRAGDIPIKLKEIYGAVVQKIECNL